jgi:SAM-dependent methyltransferase
MLAMALNTYAGTVIGIDPDPAMIDVARRRAQAAGMDIEWHLGSSYGLTDDLAPLDLVVMGRSFHWMDRDAVLARFDQLLNTHGVVAAVFTDTVRCSAGQWITTFDRVRSEFGRVDDCAAARAGPDWDTTPAVMMRSIFANVSRHSVYEQRVFTIDDLMVRALSHSGSAPAVLGDRLLAFKATLKERLLEIRPDGTFPEIVESTAIIARQK